jgi:putative (di)nucleoside polyphosphate hydrolase
MPEIRYRPNVCIVIKKTGSDLLLLCHRKGYSKKSGWQFPQGGIDKNADLLVEMKRELREEIGTDDVGVLAVSKKKYTYDFPSELHDPRPGYRGQIQQWVLVELQPEDSFINFCHEPAEFDAFKWVTAPEALQEIVDFKKQIYSSALFDMGLLSESDLSPHKPR